MKSRYSLQYKPISHQSLCYSAGDILSRVNSEFDICYIQCKKSIAENSSVQQKYIGTRANTFLHHPPC